MEGNDTEVGRITTLNETVIETHARYLIEDQIRATRSGHSAHGGRRHRRLRTLSAALGTARPSSVGAHAAFSGG